MRTAISALALAALWAMPAQADWELDGAASRINFVSTKANTAAEVHTFGAVDGQIDEDGNGVDATIDTTWDAL